MIKERTPATSDLQPRSHESPIIVDAGEPNTPRNPIPTPRLGAPTIALQCALRNNPTECNSTGKHVKHTPGLTAKAAVRTAIHKREQPFRKAKNVRVPLVTQPEDLSTLVNTFFLSKRPVHNVPRAIVRQVQCKIQISAKLGCAYGLQLMTAPPWFPIEVGVVMSSVLPTRLDPSAFCGVLAAVATALPTRWGPNVHAAASVSGILFVGLVGLFASIVWSYVCRRRGSTVSCLPSVSAGATCRLPVIVDGQAASRCQHSASGIGC